MTTMATKSERANRTLPAGTLVVSKTDGEPGRVVRVGTYRRSGLGAWTYVVETAEGLETWDAGDIFVPEEN